MSSISNDDFKNFLHDLTNKKVVQHNDLISSVAKMDAIPLKIFELAVSAIDIENPPKNHTIYLSKKTLFAFFDVHDTNKHHRFKKAIERMQKQAYFVIRKVDGNKEIYFESIIPIPYVRWNNYDDEVTIEFNHRIMPYLIDLKTNFTQYAIKDILNLHSKYSVILYKWLVMHFNQFDHYRDKLTRTSKQLESYENPSISIGELRELTNTVKTYSDFRNFEKRVIKDAIKEISKETNLNVTYEKVKKGRSIAAIKFFINKKIIAPNSFYKEEESDIKYLHHKELSKQQQTQIYLEAQQHAYTKLLNINGLIQLEDILDIDIMLELFNYVYPKYDELKSFRNEEAVNRHMEYVKEKMMEYSDHKKNIPRYLRIAIEDYLQTVKFQQDIKDGLIYQN